MGNQVDWSVIQLSYQKGEGTCKELAERYGVTPKSVSHRCTREGWKKESKLVGELVGKKVIESLATQRLSRIQAHHDLVVPIAESLCLGVKQSYQWTANTPSGADPAHLNALAQTLSKANATALLNLGFVEQKSVDITTNGQSLHEHSLSLLSSVRELYKSGKLAKLDEATLDIEGITKRLEESKKLD